MGATAAVQLADRGGGPRTRDLIRCVGPIPDLLADTMEWVERNTRSTMGYDERGHGVDQPEPSMRAVKEIITNALVHRNLDPITGSKRVEIRLMTDRLVVTNPGGLWGVSEGQLGRSGPGPATATAEGGKEGITRHGSAALAALTQPRTMTELKRETGLAEGQLRFALRRLQGSSQVATRGARGIQATRYERVTK